MSKKIKISGSYNKQEKSVEDFIISQISECHEGGAIERAESELNQLSKSHAALVQVLADQGQLSAEELAEISLYYVGDDEDFELVEDE